MLCFERRKTCLYNVGAVALQVFVSERPLCATNVEKNLKIESKSLQTVRLLIDYYNNNTRMENNDKMSTDWCTCTITTESNLKLGKKSKISSKLKTKTFFLRHTGGIYPHSSENMKSDLDSFAIFLTKCSKHCFCSYNILFNTKLQYSCKII